VIDDLPQRRATLVLCTPDGAVLGSLPPLDVPVPWWQQAGDVVAAAREVHGLDVVLLRLLSTSRLTMPGGDVTYLAEVASAPNLELLPCNDPTIAQDHPLRQTWARPGGTTADLAWVDDVLAARGTPRTAPAQQVRSWNLSSLWRVPTSSGGVWLKVVPPFFAHEGRMLARLDPAIVPRLIAHDGPRVLLEEIAGEDQYDAAAPLLLRMVDLLVGLQAEWVGRSAELLSLGATDFRPDALLSMLAGTFERRAADLDPAIARRLESLVASLPQRFADLASCGVPETLVHGDFHPGNVRGDEQALVLLDWGDSAVGHPMLDQAAFVQRLDDGDRVLVTDRWAALWRAAVPGCEPERAAALLQPVNGLRLAALYQMFLDNIEPSERVYHATDPAAWLNRAAAVPTSDAARPR
jgi:Phosphotransferase enzyme family